MRCQRCESSNRKCPQNAHRLALPALTHRTSSPAATWSDRPLRRVPSILVWRSCRPLHGGNSSLPATATSGSPRTTGRSAHCDTTGPPDRLRPNPTRPTPSRPPGPARPSPTQPGPAQSGIASPPHTTPVTFSPATSARPSTRSHVLVCDGHTPHGSRHHGSRHHGCRRHQGPEQQARNCDHPEVKPPRGNHRPRDVHPSTVQPPVQHAHLEINNDTFEQRGQRTSGTNHKTDDIADLVNRVSALNRGRGVGRSLNVIVIGGDT